MSAYFYEETPVQDYNDEESPYHDDYYDTDGDVFSDTMYINRPESAHSPITDPNNEKAFNPQLTSRTPIASPNLWRNLFSKPAILVGKRFIFDKRRKQNNLL